MNLYLLRQDVLKEWDTFDACVVAAENEDAARRIRPFRDPFGGEGYGEYNEADESEWPDPGAISVRLIGRASDDLPAGCICSSFNAG